MADEKKPRYKCPGCGQPCITHGMPKCPKCGKSLNWGVPERKAESRKDTSKNYLLNGYYWFRLLAMLFPAIGIVLLFLNKDYKNNLNRKKSEVYDRFFKKVVIYTSVWVILIIVLIVAAMMATKKAQNGGV